MTRFIPLFGSVLLLLAGIGVYLFLCVNIAQSVSTAATAQASASGTGEQELFQQSIQTFMQDTVSQRTELSGFVTKDTDVVSLINAIDAAAKREKVSVTIGSVSVLGTEWKYHEPLEVALSAQGSFSALALFATDLESLPTASHLSAMTADASTNHTWFDTFTVDFVKEKAPTP